MLKWTVSRSLSTSTSTTPHGPAALDKAARRPFRDLSNTPPSAASRTRIPLQNAPNATLRTTPSRRRRCRSQGSDLRAYFQATKPNSSRAGGKLRQSISQATGKAQRTESFYQSTPRVDTDIGPLTVLPSTQMSIPGRTLPIDPMVLSTTSTILQNTAELPQNLVNEARANLQSHVSDFFQQISLAGSPEDVMEAGSVSRTQNSCCSRHEDGQHQGNKYSGEFVWTPCLPKLSKITKLHPKCRSSCRAKLTRALSPLKSKDSKQTPLDGKLSSLNLDQDIPKFENMDNTVIEVLNKERESKGRTEKSVAEILLNDAEERRRVRERASDFTQDPVQPSTERFEMELEEEITEGHNDSSISSASQLLEDPSPMSWTFTSPLNESTGEFTLKRQRGIRRKRTRKPNADNQETSDAKRAKKPLAEAVNRDVRKFTLETDLDSVVLEDKRDDSGDGDCDGTVTTTTKEDVKLWELQSPESFSTKSDDFRGSESFLNSATDSPEVPLVATVRRCLEYSPECDVRRVNRRGFIEIESFLREDHIHVHVVRCRDLRRNYEGPVHAYVKATLKSANGESSVKRTAVHKATPNPVFHETLILPCPSDGGKKITSLDIAVWHRDRRARRSELLGCMTLPLPLSQDKEASWHPLEAGSGRNTATPYSGLPRDCGLSPLPPTTLAKDGESDNENSGSEDLTYLRHLELEPVDPLTGLPLHPGFTARGGRTPCTVTRRLIRQGIPNQIPWGFSLSWGKPPRVERVDTGSPAERSGLRPGDFVVFVETTNVVTRPRDDILGLIQAATNQLVLEVYRKGGARPSTHRPSSVNVTLPVPLGINGNQQTAVSFNVEVFPNLAPDAPPEEELSVRETRYWATLKSGHSRFAAPLAERRDVLSVADHTILFQNIEELLKISEEIKDEGGGTSSYLSRVPRITAAYRRYLGGLQRACCLLVALRRNTAFAKLVCEPAVPNKRRPDLTGVLLLPLEHYREMTRLVGLGCPRNCQEARDLAQGYREATANAGVMEPPRDTGKPLLSLQEVESRLVFARCKPFTLAMPGRQWLFGGALAKVEGRGRLQSTWALLLTDLLVFARVSRDRVLFVTDEPLRLSNIAEACFTVRKRPTEFRLQVSINPNGNGSENGHGELISSGGGCSPHGRPRRRVLILRAPNPELKAVWHNLLQRQIIFVNTGYGCTPTLGSPDEISSNIHSFPAVHESAKNSQILESEPSQVNEDKGCHSAESLDTKTLSREDNHLAEWVQNSHRIPTPDHDGSLEEWTAEDLAARAPKDTSDDIVGRDNQADEIVTGNSDVEQQSTTSSASLSTVKSNSQHTGKNGSLSKDSESITGSSINICRRCHRSGCPTPPVPRDPFSPLPPKISVLPPTPDLCTKHRLWNGLNDSPGRNSPNCTPVDGNTEDGSEDDLDCDGEPPYRALRRFGTMSSLDQDDDLDEQPEDETRDTDSPSTGLRAWTARASSYVVSKMVLLEQLGEDVSGYLLQPPVPPERTEFSLDPNEDEGTTSGATSGDDIWGTPTSGGPDDESFTASPPPTNGSAGTAGNTGTSSGEDNYGLSLNAEDEQDADSETEDCSLPELNMEQLLGNVGSSSGSMGSLGCFLGRRRLEPLPEEDDSPGSGKYQVGWW